MRVLILILVSALFLQGCLTRVVYKTPDLPRLKTYSVPDSEQYDLGVLRVVGETICIDKWSTCIPREDFTKLVNYIKAKNTVINKYTIQAEDFNALLDKVLSESK